MQRRGYSANFWISTQSLLSEAMDNRTEVVPDKTMELLICFFVDDNELRIVISTAASIGVHDLTCFNQPYRTVQEYT
jgi:hypothetical protein